MSSVDIKETSILAQSQYDESISSSSGTKPTTKKTGRPEFIYNERERNNFYKDLIAFHENRNTPIVRFPRINGRYVDLHRLYAEVIKRGGWLKVNARNEWEDLIPIINLKNKCVNMSVALKHIYTRYLDKYEKLNFLGEDPDRTDEQDDEGGRHKKWSTKNFHSVPMKYNHNQHHVTEQIRIMNKLSTDLYKGSEYDKLILSLMSPLPNEQDFAINVCTLMANESKHTLKVNHCPKLVDALIAHAGVYCHFTIRELFHELYTNIRKHSLQSFWTDCLYDKPQMLELSYEDYFQSSDDKLSDGVLYRPPLRLSHQERNEDGLNANTDDCKLDFLSLGRGLGTHDYIGQRINQVASIIRNLSFFEENIPVFARNKTFVRFIIMCANIRWGHIHHMALDICGNIATELELSDPTSDDLTRCLLSTICEGLEGEDRGVIISCLEILTKLCQKDINEDHLHKCLDQKIYNQICLFLSLNDIMLLLYTLECVYALSSFGPKSCNALIQVRGIVDTLVSLITVEAQSYGPDGCILMRVVETVPGNMLPIVAQNIANLQNLSMSGQMAVQMHHHHHGGQMDSATNIPDPPKFTGNILNQAAAASPANSRIITHHHTTTPHQIVKETVVTPNLQPQSTLKQENEQFALTWLAANFELINANESRIDQQELYKMYLSANQKAGRRGQVTAINFPRLVRMIFGTNVGPILIKVTDQNGTEFNSFHYVCLRAKSNPLPTQYKGVIISPNAQTAMQQQQQQQQQQQSQTMTSTATTINDAQNETKIMSPQISKNNENFQKPNIKNISDEMTGMTIQIKQGKKGHTVAQQLQQSEQLQITHIPISKEIQQQQQQQQQQQKPIQISGKQQHAQFQLSTQNQTMITNNRLQEPQNQIQPINKISKNITVTQHHITSQVVATTTNTNKTVISHAGKQQLQHQQQRPVILQQTQQHQMKNNTSSITVNTVPSQNITLNSLNSTTGSSTSQSSLVKSLLANKVTTTVGTDVIDVANASAALNNPSCLITQNVNLHQVAQRQHLQKQKQLQQQQHKQQLNNNGNLATTTINALVSNPVIPATAVKVGQTTIKAITSNAVIPSTVLEKKSVVTTTAPINQMNDDLLPEIVINNKSNWEIVPTLAPISIQGRSALSIMNMAANFGSNIIIQQATNNEDPNSIGNMLASSGIINSIQINPTDDGEGSLINLELLIPKSKSVTENEISSKQAVFSANQMLVDLLDKKSDPPINININQCMKRKLEDDYIVYGNERKKFANKKYEDDEPMVAPSKNAANLYAEIAASILEDEDLQEESTVIDNPMHQSPIHIQIPGNISQSNQRIHTPVIQKAPEPSKQVITMPMPVQRQIIVAPNNSHQMLIASSTQNQCNQSTQATATIKTDGGLQTIPVILQKHIVAAGQQIIQPVIQQPHPPQPTQYMLATNPQGQTYLVAQQQPAPQTVLLAQTPQQQGTSSKTIIILQQPGGAPQPVAQQQIINSPGGSQKVIMTTQQGQQMIMTQMPRTVQQQHQLIVNHPANNTIRNTGPANVVISQSGGIIQQPQAQIHIQSPQPQPQMSNQVQKQKMQMQVQHQTPLQNQNITQQTASIQLPHIPATIKVHTPHIPQVQIQSPNPNKPQFTKSQHTTQQLQQPAVSVLPYQPQMKKKELNQNTAIQQQTLNNIAMDKREIRGTTGNNSETVVRSQTPQPSINITMQQNHINVATTNHAVASTSTVSNMQPPTITPNATHTAIPTESANSSLMSPTTSVDNSSHQLQNPQQPTTLKQKSVNDSKITNTNNNNCNNNNNNNNNGNEDETVEIDWLYVCDWRNCPRKKFKSLNEVYRHACIVHCPDNLDLSAEIYCQWGTGSVLCDNIPRKRFSLMTHLLDRHCTIESFKAAVQRRIANGIPPLTHGQPVTIIKNLSSSTSTSGTTGVDSKGTDSPTHSVSSVGSLPSTASAAMHAIKRHTADFVNPKELMDENEGPVTKSIRLAAALILRNLVTHTTTAKRNVRHYEPHLSGVALSNVESSRTVSQILFELNN